MKTTQDYFAHYEAIAALSSCMLVAARNGQWGELRTMQGAYRDLIEGLKEVDTSSELDDLDRARKLDLVRRILADDAAIRDLTTPSLALYNPSTCGEFQSSMPPREMQFALRYEF